MPLAAVIVAAILTTAAFRVVAGRTDTPASDEALLEVKTQNAAALQETSGPYSRFGWSHPGPLLFYAQAPFYVLGGRRPASLYAGAVLINLSFIVLALYAAWRMGPWSALAASAAVCLVAWRASPVLASPWNPHLLLFPWLALIASGGAWAERGGALLLAAVVFCGTWLVQTHIGAGPSVLLVLGAVAALRKPRLLTRPVAIAFAFGVLLWAPVLVDVVAHRSQSNPWQIAGWFAHDTHGHLGLRNSLKAAGESLTAFVRPQPVAVPVGWAWRPSGRTAQNWAMACGALFLGLLAVRRRRSAAVLTASVLVGGVFTAWSVRGEMVDHLLFWLGGGVPALLAVGASSELGAASRARRCATVALVLAFAGCAAMAMRQLGAQPVRQDPSVSAAAQILVGTLGRDLDHTILDLDDGCWSEGAGIVAQLRRERRGIRVPESLGFMYGRTVTADNERGLPRVIIRREDTSSARRMIEARGAPQFVAGVLQIWLIHPFVEQHP